MISAVVLAAGTSSRMGRSKALEPLGGRPLLQHVIDSVKASAVGQVIVVLGHESDRVRREVPMDGATVVVNPDFREGMSTSLRAGIRELDPKAEAFFVLLGDQPLLAPASLDTLASRRAESGAKILIPTFAGRRGNPALIDRSLSAEVEAIKGDLGCRAIFGDHPNDIVEVPVNDPGVLLDVDTPEQLERIRTALAHGESLASVARYFDSPAHGPRRHEGVSREARSTRSQPNLNIVADELRNRGEPFVSAVVVRAVKPTSGKPGNKAIVRPGAAMIGWLGGSCVESAVLAESKAALRDGRPRLLRLSREASRQALEEGVVDYVMECHSGGAMDIYLEPHVPKPRLLVVGDSPVAAALTSFGQILGYHVIAVARHAEPDAFPDADEVIPEVGRLVEFASRDTYAVVATMGKYDASAVGALATSSIAYVGLVASRKRAAALFDELRGTGVPAEALDRVRSPAGLDIAGQTSEEVALSIMAEIIRERRAAAPARELPMAREAPVRPATLAVDPVCGMEVDPATELRAIHMSTTYYFCSEGCRARFLKSPDAFLA